MKQISLLDIKQAMADQRFRDSLPPELQEDVQKYLSNPSCKCNVPIYVRIFKECQKEIQNYFPGRTIGELDENIKKQNHWTVINCHITELEKKLKQLPIGAKQLAVARYEDQVTVVVNELEVEN